MKFPVIWLPFVTVPVGGYIAGPHQLNSCQNFNLREQISNKQTNKHTLGFQPQIPAIQKTHCYGDVTSQFTPLCFSKKASVSCTSLFHFATDETHIGFSTVNISDVFVLSFTHWFHLLCKWWVVKFPSNKKKKLHISFASNLEARNWLWPLAGGTLFFNSNCN